MSFTDNQLWYMNTILKKIQSCLLYYDRSKYYAHVVDFDGTCIRYEGDTPNDINIELIKHVNGGIMPDGA